MFHYLSHSRRVELLSGFIYFLVNPSLPYLCEYVISLHLQRGWSYGAQSMVMIYCICCFNLTLLFINKIDT